MRNYYQTNAYHYYTAIQSAFFLSFFVCMLDT